VNSTLTRRTLYHVTRLAIVATLVVATRTPGSQVNAAPRDGLWCHCAGFNLNASPSYGFAYAYLHDPEYTFVDQREFNYAFPMASPYNTPLDCWFACISVAGDKEDDLCTDHNLGGIGFTEQDFFWTITNGFGGSISSQGSFSPYGTHETGNPPDFCPQHDC
jgi:hypothetical protein